MANVTINDHTYDATERTTWLGHVLGLMFQPPKTLLFTFPHEQTITLHSLFVFHTFTAVFINAEHKVVQTTTFQPFTTTATATAKYVLETPATVNANTGDTVHIND